MTKAYIPNKKEINNLKKRNHYFKISGDRVFASLQGEGLLKSEGGTAGCPAVFLRLHWCNLSCGKPTGWKCDSNYTWDKEIKEYWHEPVDWTIVQTQKEIEKEWLNNYGKTTNQKRLVITGGEPLIQQDLIVDLVKSMLEWKIEIETNGTIKPRNELLSCQLNCSPKLSNSGNKLTNRYKPEVLKIINNWPTSWFKFVVNNPNDLKEITKIAQKCNINTEKILIMPEGIYKKDVLKNSKTIKKNSKFSKYQFANRNQLFWFGSKRRT